MPHDPPMLLGILLCFFAAGLVKGVIGMGLPTLAMGLLGLMMSAPEAAALLVLPSLVTNLWQMLGGGLTRLKRLSRRLLLMQAGVVAGTFVGIHFLVSGRAALSSAILGAVLFVYALAGLRGLRWRVSPASERWLSPATGAATGVLSGATGVFVIPAVSYLASLELEKEDLIQALGLSFTVSTLALGLALFSQGAFTVQAAGNFAWAVAPALAGMFAGQALRMRLSAETFRRWFFVSLAVIGLYMIGRAAF